jgi:predicted regulator of Ras-like GTPase activity (Roadblock/LC7/MglB family)
MASPKDRPRVVPLGFEGEVAGMGLPDVLQLHALNRFTGCITVRYLSERGLVFLKDGEIVHAEAGGLAAEQAFYEILSWPGGSFVLQPNVLTTRPSIQKGLQFLLLEAHRLMDEQRSSPAPGPARRAEPAPGLPSPEAVAAHLRGLPGVAQAVALGPDGSPLGDASPQAEWLSGQAAYLGLFARRLGELFEAGPLRVAAVHGAQHHLLLSATATFGLGVLTAMDGPITAIEAELVRHAVGPT